MRNLSPRALQSINARETGEVWLSMIHLSHSDWAGDDVYLVANTEDVTHQGQVYLAFPVAVDLPDEGDEVMPVVDWVASNIAQELTARLRSVSGPIDGRVFWVLADTPDVIEIGPMDLQMRVFDHDSTWLSGQLVIEPVLDSIFGSKLMDNGNAPGLF